MYVANIQLGFMVDDPAHADAALTYFQNNIWSPIPNDWSAILVHAEDPGELVEYLNGEFINNLASMSPYQDISNWTLLAPFTIFGWHRGANGLHENGPNLMKRQGSPTPLDCTFNYPGGAAAKLFARATFFKVAKALGEP